MVPRCPSTVHRHPNNQELVSAIKLVSLVVYNKLVFSLTKCVTTPDKEGGPSFSKHIYQPFLGEKKMHFMCPKKLQLAKMFVTQFIFKLGPPAPDLRENIWGLPDLDDSTFVFELMGQNWRMLPEF